MTPPDAVTEHTPLEKIPPSRDYTALPHRLKTRLDEVERRIARFPQRRWM